MKRIAIFIDGAYLDKVFELRFDRAKVDYSKLIRLMSCNSELLRAYYYHAPPYMSDPPTEEETNRLNSKNRFFNVISSIPRTEVKLGQLVYRGKNANGSPIFIQKGVDVVMSVDMLRIAATSQVDHIIVAAGDSDFAPAILAVKEHGVLTTLWYVDPVGYGKPRSRNELKEYFDERVLLTKDIIDKVLR